MRIVKPSRYTNIYLKSLPPVQPRVIRRLQMVLKSYIFHTLIPDVKLQLISISVFRKRKKNPFLVCPFNFGILHSKQQRMVQSTLYFFNTFSLSSMQEHRSLFQTCGYGLASETLSLVGCSHLLPLFIHISKSIKTSVLVTTRKKPYIYIQR